MLYQLSDSRHVRIGVSTKPTLTATQLTNAKADMLRLMAAYVYAVKELLRGEQGPSAELTRVLPHGMRGLSEDGGPGVLTSSGRSETVSRRTSYQAISKPGTVRRKRENSEDLEASAGSTNGREPLPSPVFGIHSSGVTLPDANASTPLLGDSEQNVEFHPYANTLRLPLPLVYVHGISYRSVNIIV